MVFKRISFVTLIIFVGACTLIGENDSKEPPLEDPPPVGGKLVFSMDDSATGQHQIFTMNIDGSELTQLTNNPDYGSHYPVWSPDGSQIAYSSSLCGAQNLCAYLMNDDGSEQNSMGRTSPDSGSEIKGYYFSWKPEGKMIAFNQCQGFPGCGFVSVYDLESESLRYIDGGWHPSWSPNGEYLVFSADKAYGDDDWRDILYVANADGSGEAHPITTPGMASKPTWSPKNDYIAYIGRDEEKVYIYEIEAQKVMELKTDLKYGRGVQWSRHGKLLMVIGQTESNNSVLQFFHNTGKGLKFIEERLYPGGRDIKWYYDEEGD